VVMGSMLLAVAAGLWPLAAQPFLLGSLLAIFVGTALAARWRFAATATIVLFFAYIAYGVARIVAGPGVASMPFWLAAFAGLALGGSSRSEWRAVGGWRIPLAWWATGVAVTWPFVFASEVNYALPTSQAGGPIVTTALLQMALALWMDRLLAAPGDRAGGHVQAWSQPRWARALAAGAAVTAAAAIYQRVFDLSWLSGEPWAALRRAVGLMGDANPMGVATALWAPLAWTLTGSRARGTVAATVLAALLWGAAWVSGARTTIILMAMGAAGLVFTWGARRGISLRTIVAAVVIAGALGLALMTMVAPRVAPGTPLGRLVAFTPEGSPWTVAYEMLWRRDGYGLAAVQAIREHPITGVGIGRFTGLSTSYHQRLTGRAIPPDNAQNFWRHTLAEQGVLGLLPILWLTALTLRALFAPLSSSDTLLVRVMVSGLGIALVFGYPVQDPAIAVTLATMVAEVARARS
ncbi:MAG: O-antigen ligase family protein, partial [Vicinamibacterales bacterium]